METLPKGSPYGFDNLMLDCIKNNRKVEVKLFDGFWHDIGFPHDYDKANEHYVELKEKLGL